MRKVLQTHWRNLAFSGLILQEVLDRPLEDETPQARLKEIGMMIVPYTTSQAHQELTLTKITEVTGLTRSGVKETVDLLVRRGMLTETMIKNSMGRGTARRFEVSNELLAG